MAVVDGERTDLNKQPSSQKYTSVLDNPHFTWADSRSDDQIKLMSDFSGNLQQAVHMDRWENQQYHLSAVD